jgi:hypothetical protein
MFAAGIDSRAKVNLNCFYRHEMCAMLHLIAGP